jgi:hypothetical protein
VHRHVIDETSVLSGNRFDDQTKRWMTPISNIIKFSQKPKKTHAAFPSRRNAVVWDSKRRSFSLSKASDDRFQLESGWIGKRSSR